MIKQIDPALKSAYDEWAKTMPDNYVKHGAMLFITSLPYFKYLYNHDLKVKKSVKQVEVQRMN